MKRVYDFSEGRASMNGLLGGKGANLSEMTYLGLPVPTGMIVSTKACMDYLDAESTWDDSLQEEIMSAIHRLEERTERYFGKSQSLLLVSVRSGAPISMPGMMDTILNVGLTDETVIEFAKKTSPQFAYDCYRRLLQMFGEVVYDLDSSVFSMLIEQFELRLKKDLSEFTQSEMEEVIEEFKQVYIREGKEFPQDPIKQVMEAIQAVFQSWNNHRAKVYRSIHNIDERLGTAVVIQQMVFGNSGMKSGTGVAFTRNPATGEKTLYGEFLLNAQGEDIVAGIRTPQKIEQLKSVLPATYQQFVEVGERLEHHFRDMQDIEFTIEDEKLYVLQTRNGKRTAKAALRIAVDMTKEGFITQEEALLRVQPDDMNQLLHPVFVESELAHAEQVAKGLAASPGAATGRMVFTAQEAKHWSDAGEKVILVRQETSPEDIEGMIVSEAIVTSRGGLTSHAAVVARGLGTCCVVGCEAIRVMEQEKQVETSSGILKEGDVISVDGTTGWIYKGEISTQISDKDDYFHQLMDWADQSSTLKVYANAETPRDLRTAFDFGAKGVGLARTEHMFFKEERLVEMRRLILEDDEQQKQSALRKLLEYQQQDFYEMYRIADNYGLIVRLLDPPMHEFLPSGEEEVKELASILGMSEEKIYQRMASLREVNPMLGHRGCRLGVTDPLIYQMQVEAIVRSVLDLQTKGVIIRPKIMIPLVGELNELLLVKDMIEQKMQEIFDMEGKSCEVEIGTMIELPRACFIADELAQHVDFFSFGTNDLTQMTYGFSRDDIGKFMPSYVEKGIIVADPFQTIDEKGVGALIQMAIEKARSVKPGMSIGVCGEIGGDSQSIRFFNRVGVDYVSCSPYRVPIARISTARAAIG